MRCFASYDPSTSVSPMVSSVAVDAYSDDAGFTQYCIKVIGTEQHPVVNRRFSEFLQLHKDLKRAEPFPCTKRWFHPASVKIERQAAFDAYLKRIVTEPLLPPIIAFLGLPSNRPPDAPPAAKPAALAVSSGLQAKLGTVVGIHSDEDWAMAKQESKEKNFPMVVDFTATWCGPVRGMDPSSLRRRALSSLLLLTRTGPRSTRGPAVPKDRAQVR